MNLKAYFAHKTDKGKVRDNNEDSVLVGEELNFAAVADGMGGHNSGELASSIAVKVLKEQLETLIKGKIKPPDFNSAFSLETNQLGFAATLANKIIYEASKNMPENKGMGTTLSGIFINGNKASIAHIGDSRIYVLRGGKLQQITQDHSLVMEQVRKGIITKEQAEVSKMQNILTRALGTREKSEIDSMEFELAGNDRFLMCTDGLFKPLSETEIEKTMADNPDPSAACEVLVAKANDAGGPDNVTVAIIDIKAKTWKDSMQGLLGRLHA